MGLSPAGLHAGLLGRDRGGAKLSPDAGWLVANRARLFERRGRNIATVATARKLLTLVYYGLRDGHIRALGQAETAARAGPDAAGCVAPSGSDPQDARSLI